MQSIETSLSQCTHILAAAGAAYPRTCAVCGLGKCKNSEAKALYEASLPTDFDVVKKAKHYNTHPSGIEAIHIVRCLNFDMGCFVKYVMRRHGKEYARSLNSAEYYLRDQHSSGTPMVLNYSVFRLLDDYAQAEKVSQLSTLYKLVSVYLTLPSTSNFEMLLGALSRVREGGL